MPDVPYLAVQGNGLDELQCLLQGRERSDALR